MLQAVRDILPSGFSISPTLGFEELFETDICVLSLL